ncbi:MAG: Virulence factor MVIN family protein, partial [Candidatus Daviesbacteria bacterium GW2011_GWA1_38_7]
MVKNLLNMLSSRQNSILSGASILMVAVFASKFLGLIRDRLLVRNFSSAEAAIFFAAFRLPDLMFQLLIFGALSVAFIPIFTEHLNKEGESEAFDFANSILNLSLVAFLILGTIAFIFIGPLNSLLIPGFAGEQKIQTDSLSRIILLGQILLVIGAFFVGIAQSFQRFI